MTRVILHSDLNNFYATAETSQNEALRGLPLAVAGDEEQRHGIVLAKSMEAKAYGVKTGDTLWQARQKCPDIVFVRPNFDLYNSLAAKVRKIYDSFTDRVESFGIDECWLDITGSLKLFCPMTKDVWVAGRLIADEIRRRVKEETGLTVSVGVSFNKVFAKLASDMKKPDATTLVTPENYKKVAWSCHVGDLLFAGPKTTHKLEMYGIHTIGQLAGADESFLRLLLGKSGTDLHMYANGYDFSPVLRQSELPSAKSISNGSTASYDLISDDEIKALLYTLCESVSARLRRQGMVCRTVQIGIRESNLYSYERQGGLEYPSRSAKTLFKKAYELFCRHRTPGCPIRSLTVRAVGLSEDISCQIPMFPEVCPDYRRENLESCVDSLRDKFGYDTLKRGIFMANKNIIGSDYDADRRDILHRVAH